MKEKESIYNGVTIGEFMQAVRTATSFVSGLASAPINPDTRGDLVVAGFVIIPFLETHNAFVAKLKSLKDDLEAQLEDGSKTEATTESAHIMNSNN